MIDLKAIENRIKEIERRRSLLEDYKEMPYEEFVSDLSIYELAIRHARAEFCQRAPANKFATMILCSIIVEVKKCPKK